MYPFQCDPSPQKRLAGSTPETVPLVPSAPGAEHVNGDTSALLLLLRYRSRCQDDIFPRIELIPSFVLSSDNTNCKNDIQLFHQLFDELSVHTDYH